MDNLTIRPAQLPDEFPTIQAIRTQVFQIEQQVDPSLEFDGRDTDAKHWLAFWNGEPIGTLRVRLLTPETAKIERLAVLSNHRRRGIGRQLILAALSALEFQGVAIATLNAQIYVAKLYESLGFQPIGDPFEEAGIPHIKMERK